MASAEIHLATSLRASPEPEGALSPDVDLASAWAKNSMLLEIEYAPGNRPREVPEAEGADGVVGAILTQS